MGLPKDILSAYGALRPGASIRMQPLIGFNTDNEPSGGSAKNPRSRGKGKQQGTRNPRPTIATAIEAGADTSELLGDGAPTTVLDSSKELPTDAASMQLTTEDVSPRKIRAPRDRRPSKRKRKEAEASEEERRRQRNVALGDDLNDVHRTVVIGSEHPWGDTHLAVMPTEIPWARKNILETALDEVHLSDMLSEFLGPERREPFIRQIATLASLTAILDASDPATQQRRRPKKTNGPDPITTSETEIEYHTYAPFIIPTENIIEAATTNGPILAAAGHRAAETAESFGSTLSEQIDNIAGYAASITGPQALANIDDAHFIDATVHSIRFLNIMVLSAPASETIEANIRTLTLEQSARDIHALAFGRTVRPDLAKTEAEVIDQLDKIDKWEEVKEALSEAGKSHPHVTAHHRPEEVISADRDRITTFEAQVAEVLASGSAIFSSLCEDAMIRARSILSEHMQTVKNLRAEVDNPEGWQDSTTRKNAERSLASYVRTLMPYFDRIYGHDEEPKQELVDLATIRVPREVRLRRRRATQARDIPAAVTLDTTFERAYAASRDILTSRDKDAKAIATGLLKTDNEGFLHRVSQNVPEAVAPGTGSAIGPVGIALIAAIGAEILTPRNVDELDTVIDSFARAARGESVQNITALEQRDLSATISMRNRLSRVTNLQDEVNRLSILVSNFSVTQEIITAMTGTGKPTEEREAMHSRLFDTLDWLKTYLVTDKLDRMLVLTPGEKERAGEIEVFLRNNREHGLNNPDE